MASSRVENRNERRGWRSRGYGRRHGFPARRFWQQTVPRDGTI